MERGDIVVLTNVALIDRFPIYGELTMIEKGDVVKIVNIDSQDKVYEYKLKLIDSDKEFWVTKETTFTKVDKLDTKEDKSSLKMELIKLLNQLAAIIDDMED